MKEKNKIGLSGLVAIGIGSVIGAGIFSMMGTAIGSTGRSVPVALILASFLVFAKIYARLCCPVCLHGIEVAMNRPH